MYAHTHTHGAPSEAGAAGLTNLNEHLTRHFDELVAIYDMLGVRQFFLSWADFFLKTQQRKEAEQQSPTGSLLFPYHDTHTAPTPNDGDDNRSRSSNPPNLTLNC